LMKYPTPEWIAMQNALKGRRTVIII
jgi:hypothetical protein